MKAVIGNMRVSPGGVLRLGKMIQDFFGIKSGDQIVILQDNESKKVTLQLQRDNKVLVLLDSAELIKT